MRMFEMVLIVVIAFGVLSGMLTFVSDLSKTYDIELPGDLENKTQDFMDKINKTSTDIVDIAQSEGSWVETTYNIFFRLPSNILTTLTNTISITTAFASTMIDSTGSFIPSWVSTVIFVLISIVIAFAVVYFVSGRSM